MSKLKLSQIHSVSAISCKKEKRKTNNNNTSLAISSRPRSPFRVVFISVIHCSGHLKKKKEKKKKTRDCLGLMEQKHRKGPFLCRPSGHSSLTLLSLEEAADHLVSLELRAPGGRRNGQPGRNGM